MTVIIARSWWSMAASGFVGGINLSRTYENPPSAGIPADGDTQHAYWRDTAVEIRGPAVAELQRLFFDTWKTAEGRSGPCGRTTFRPSRARACKPYASSAARQAISSRSITSRWSRRSAWRSSASGCPAAISCRRTRSARIWQGGTARCRSRTGGAKPQRRRGRCVCRASRVWRPAGKRRADL